MENILDITAEALLFLVKRIKRLSRGKEELTQFQESEQREQDFIKDTEIIRCITKLLITVAVVILVLKADIAKLGLLLGFVLFAMIIYMALRD